MIERTYQILNKVVRLSLETATVIPDGFERFLCSSAEKPDIVFRSDCESEDHCCYGIGYLSGNGKKIKNIFFSRKDRGQILYSYEDNYSQMQLRLDGNCTKEILSELLMAGFYSYMSLQEALLLHASAVCRNGKAIVFTAASGVGKTTQAELWQKYRNATIINGDKIFLTEESDKIIAWGSPWKGSSPYAEKIGAEVAAFVILEQAEKNQIRKLSGMEILEKLHPHIFFPSWDAQCESVVLDFLNNVLARTEVYLLSCRPDEEAVALLEKTVF